MDVLIEKGAQSTRLSWLGLYNITIDDSSPSVEIKQRTVTGRSGYIYDGLDFLRKTIEVTGRILVEDQLAFMEKKDELNRWLFDDEAYYITKMYPEISDLYGFELPGGTTGDVTQRSVTYLPWKYRYKVVMIDAITYSFLGKSSQGLKYDIRLSFVTAELPFGETKPKTIALSSGFISYEGTAPLSQLEWPFEVELVPNGEQTQFFLEIGGRRFNYKHSSTPLKSGDKLILTGIETRLVKSGTADVNINDRTNFEYFVLKPSPNNKITYTTNFNGSIRLLNFVELYK